MSHFSAYKERTFMFRELTFKGLAPFSEGMQLELPLVKDKPVDLAEVHVLTGVNGTGKTRLLCVLAAILGNSEPLTKRTKGMKKPAQVSLSNYHTFLSVHQSGYEWLAPIPDELSRIAAFAYNGLAYVADAPVAVMAGIAKPDRKACLSFQRADSHSKELLQAVANLKVQSAMDQLNWRKPSAVLPGNSPHAGA